MPQTPATYAIGVLLVTLLFGFVRPLPAATVVLYPVADTSLVEAFPTHNLGAQSYLAAGTTGSSNRSRALLRFEPQSAIPSGARIVSAELVLVVTKQPANGYNPALFGLHRLLTNWNEGAQSGYPPALGGPAATNECSWLERLAFVQPWSAPGAAVTNEFAPQPSAQEFIYGFGDSPYTFASTPMSVADVQDWLDHPQDNFGWLLKPLDETTAYTARRFAAREDTNQAPVLSVTYLVPPKLVIGLIGSNLVQMAFTALAGQQYVLESSTNVANNQWTEVLAVGPLAVDTNIVRQESLDRTKFFRARSF